jgi:hypothetical protein
VGGLTAHIMAEGCDRSDPTAVVEQAASGARSVRAVDLGGPGCA